MNMVAEKYCSAITELLPGVWTRLIIHKNHTSPTIFTVLFEKYLDQARQKITIKFLWLCANFVPTCPAWKIYYFLRKKIDIYLLNTIFNLKAKLKKKLSQCNVFSW